MRVTYLEIYTVSEARAGHAAQAARCWSVFLPALCAWPPNRHISGPPDGPRLIPARSPSACPTQSGDMPLHRAIRHKRCALALLDWGADPHAGDQVCVWWAGGAGRGGTPGPATTSAVPLQFWIGMGQ